MLSSKRNRRNGNLNSSSLADIAFLLVIFFLVTTTIYVDTGIAMVLPPPIEAEPELIKERNLMNILVNSDGKILLDGQPTEIAFLKEKLIAFIDNNGADPELSESPDMAVISLKTQRSAPFKVYIDMLDEVMGAYNVLRDEASDELYGVSFNQLDESSAAQKFIKEMYPKRISVAESVAN